MKQLNWKYWFVQSLTFGRVPLILIFLFVTIFTDERDSNLWFSVAFFSMILSTITDSIDGYYARKFKVTSRLGAYADPLTDKIFYLVTFPTLVYLAALPAQVGLDRGWGDLGSSFHTKLLLCLAILFLMRDQWISFLRSLGAMHNVDARANWSGKWRTIISFPVICIIYYYLQAPHNFLWGILPVWRWSWLVYTAEALSLAINLISIWVYTEYYWPVLKKEAKITSE